MRGQCTSAGGRQAGRQAGRWALPRGAPHPGSSHKDTSSQCRRLPETAMSASRAGRPGEGEEGSAGRQAHLGRRPLQSPGLGFSADSAGLVLARGS